MGNSNFSYGRKWITMGSWLSFKTRMSNYGKGIFFAIKGCRLLSYVHTPEPQSYSQRCICYLGTFSTSVWTQHFFVPGLRHQCSSTKCEYNLLRHVFISVTSSCLATGVAMNSSIPHKAARDEGLGCYKLRVRLLKLNETLPNFNRTRNERNIKNLCNLCKN